MTSFAANVFDSFDEYKVTILFKPFTTTKVLSFALCCMGLSILTCCFHLLIWTRKTLEQYIRANTFNEEHTPDEGAGLVSTEYHIVSSKYSEHSKNMCGAYVGLIFLALFTNAYGMLLVMALMTFNPWVFLAMAFGYTVGDMVVFVPLMKMKMKMKK